MSKKPVPSKKQAPSSTRARHSAYVRRMRTNLDNENQTTKCQKCGEMKRSHFACQACGMYKDRQVVTPKADKAAIRHIEA